MDDAISRPRYSRYGMPNRRKKKGYRETGTLLETVLRQIVISLLILVVIGLVKSINTPVTNFLTTKVKTVLFYNLEPKSIYTGIDTLVAKVKNGSLFKKSEKTGTDEVLPASTGIMDSLDDEIKQADVDATVKSDELPVMKSNTDEMVRSINENFKFVTPVEGILTSAFGNRMNPTRQVMELHTGIDIDAESGSTVKSVLDGEVITAGLVKTYGRYIKIKHGEGLVTLYAHCSQLLVKEGQRVKQGDTIAKVGNTGISVGSHLHFEVLKDGTALNPLNFIKVPAE